MKAVTLIISLFFLLQLTVSAQESLMLKGRVFDVSTNEPIPNATIYVNGTTIGTTTNNDGRFELSGIPNSAIVVISHISYQPENFVANDDTPAEISIALLKRNIRLSEITIQNKDLRNENLRRFNSMYIGNDYWGKNARLLNDSVLIFNRKFEYSKTILNELIEEEIRTGIIIDRYEWDKDSTQIIFEKLSLFEVYANAPLEIDLPLLGYKLRVDLVDFSIEYEPEFVKVKFLGYYYFQPYTAKNNREEKKFKKNRQLVYFNSSQYFLRSLYEKKLTENGYQVFDELNIFHFGSNSFPTFNFEEYFNYSDNDQLMMIGLKDKEFSVYYYSNSSGAPLNISNPVTASEENYEMESSKLYLLNDTCILYDSGLIPNNDIMFGGTISQKKVGSYLPDDYKLPD